MGAHFTRLERKDDGLDMKQCGLMVDTIVNDKNGSQDDNLHQKTAKSPSSLPISCTPPAKLNFRVIHHRRDIRSTLLLLLIACLVNVGLGSSLPAPRSQKSDSDHPNKFALAVHVGPNGDGQMMTSTDEPSSPHNPNTKVDKYDKPYSRFNWDAVFTEWQNKEEFYIKYAKSSTLGKWKEYIIEWKKFIVDGIGFLKNWLNIKCGQGMCFAAEMINMAI